MPEQRAELALDCSGATGFVGLRLEEESSQLQFDVRKAQPAEQIAALLASRGLEIASLRYLVVGTGPGSYTATRNAVAVMQGLACAANLPLRAVRSDAAEAAQIGMDSGVPKAMLATHPARDGGWVFWLYDAGNPELLTPVEWNPEVARRLPLFCVGTGQSAEDLERLHSETGARWMEAHSPDYLRALFVLAEAAPATALEQVRPHYSTGANSYRKHGEAS